MPLNALHHVTVKTDDLEATRDFYREILGLEVGFRPDLDFPGYWLYCGPVPVVHLVPRQNAIGGGASPRTRPLRPFSFLAPPLPRLQATARQKKNNLPPKHIPNTPPP